MTSLPATAFRFIDRGLVQAELCRRHHDFRPGTITDKSTFEQPHQYSEGIRFVIVNGYPVLSRREMTGLLPGGPVLGPGTESKEKSTAARR